MQRVMVMPIFKKGKGNSEPNQNPNRGNRGNYIPNRNNRPENNNNGFKVIPHQLCKHFGLRSDERDFVTFRHKFEMAYEMYGLRDNDKATCFMMHLDKAIKTHAFSWKESRGQNNPMTYDELIKELQLPTLDLEGNCREATRGSNVEYFHAH